MAQKLLTLEARRKFPKWRSTQKTPNAEKVAVVKYFGGGRFSFYAVEFDGDETFFGYIVSPLGEDCDEWGYMSLSELQRAKYPPLNTPTERAEPFSSKPMWQALPEKFACQGGRCKAGPEGHPGECKVKP